MSEYIQLVLLRRWVSNGFCGAIVFVVPFSNWLLGFHTFFPCAVGLLLLPAAAHRFIEWRQVRRRTISPLQLLLLLKSVWGYERRLAAGRTFSGADFLLTVLISAYIFWVVAIARLGGMTPIYILAAGLTCLFVAASAESLMMSKTVKLGNLWQDELERLIREEQTEIESRKDRRAGDKTVVEPKELS